MQCLNRSFRGTVNNEVITPHGSFPDTHMDS